MNTLADALIYALAYLNVAHGDDDRQDDDCRAFESVIDTLTRSSAAEQQALVDAAARAIAAESSAEPQNHLLISTYRDILDDLQERFPNTLNA